MFFGLCNLPSIFQMMMNHIFRDMINEGWIVIYMDDILIFSDNLDEHLKRTERVLKRLQEHDLYLKPEKCKFNVLDVDFLGMKILHNKIATDPIKIEEIKNWPTPLNVKEV